MPVRVLARSDEEEFLWTLARSEADSASRHGCAWREALGPALARRLEEGDRGSPTDSDGRRLRRAFEKVRGAYLAPLLALSPTWWSAELPLDELGDIRLIRHEPFLRLAPGRRLREFVVALDGGGSTSPDRFAERYRRLRPKFSWDRVRGVPALVSTSFEGPYLEIDGLTRLSLHWSLRDTAPDLPSTVPVLLALSRRVAAWTSY